ncbi:hypothetical protein EYC98_19240 [Halieaceae bacterium IMCC14734]|uniref:Uncharacterized protein n=1 Tax=Candidatus Litorirhabdus singularis TaxID=2518993 RepID=A0ABT3TL12_9GAMM|nr:hypothetical protein [Candidatus Litorirhabdus singularis]MCX2983003.1 hypothetical protein [Candidatus Litorirhabdus singularis]
MTKLIATSVVRGSHQGESHGGVHIIDFDAEKSFTVIDWNNTAIDFQGRGWDRGLRGIAIDGERVFIAASDELFEYTPDFEMVASWRNPYLRHCHEISIFQRRLYLSSTGFDAILGFDLDNNSFCWGMHVLRTGSTYQSHLFDPAVNNGPRGGNELHINNVFAHASGLHLSGLRTGTLLRFDGEKLHDWVTLPLGVHNAQPYRDGVLFNDTQADCVRFEARSGRASFNVPSYDAQQLTHSKLDDSRIARQGFGRGLCVIGEGLIAAGSSPSTIAVHDLNRLKTTHQVTLSMDIRNAIHGLEVWPFQTA